ncbi:DUF4377 domain-containing protein [Chryseobacterium sp.]|uniref:DUF4377 domain-containing protein n=1 Tax=Chryseobacterium sp. TaxID=1871047 RepID=UPI0023570CA9|nr:DUF4377 domain-containing protein [Chryseobacterium sp.]
MKSIATILKGAAPALALFAMTQCTTTAGVSSADEKTFIVGPQTADCTGVAPMKCLQVKEKASENWTNFYTNIDGFTYEPGYEYVLKVKTEKIANPPADGSSIKYTLVKQVSKTKKEVAANEKTLIIGSQTVDCSAGAGRMKCMQVKENASENWSNFYSNIEGFTYEPGYEYVLKVKTEKIANPPADASSIKYTLIEQVSKTKK